VGRDRAVILVVDDDPPIGDIVSTALGEARYKVLYAMDAKRAIEVFQREPIDLFILDIMMPGMDGFVLCEWIRERCSVPVIMLTAKGSDNDIVHGLKVGADDYITKPFTRAELVARIEATLRRASLVSEQILTVGDISIGVMPGRVFVRGQEIYTSPLNLAVLRYLMCHAGQAIDRVTLFRDVWGRDPDDDDDLQAVTVSVYQLRERLERDPARPENIVTVRGVGYKFVEQPRNSYSAAQARSPQSNVADRVLKAPIEALIQEDRLAEALEELSKIEGQRQAAILLTRQLNHIQTQERQALVTREYVSAERNRIAQAILSLFSK
jgi:DNA-binding response OmpR family regulator